MPDWRPALRNRLVHLRLDPTREAAIVEEVAQHLDGRYADLLAGGMSAKEAGEALQSDLDRAARLASRLAPLALARVSDAVPAGTPARRSSAGAWQDLRHALRSLLRQPSFTVIACGTLAVGIAVTTAMFTLINGLLLRPLPYPDAGSLSRLYQVTPGNPSGPFTAGEFARLVREVPGVAAVAGYAPAPDTLEDAGAAAEWLSVSPGLFDVLGLRPALGRSFRADEGGPEAARVVVISHTLWESRFGRDPGIVGRVVATAQSEYVVVGVLPPAASDHRLFGRIGLFSPVDWATADDPQQRLTVVARRATGVSSTQLDAWLSTFSAGQSDAAIPGPAGPAATRLAWRSEPLPRTDTGPKGQVLLALLLGLAGSVLVIGCANLAHLVLARTLERRQEIAVRVALGASRLQLARIVLFESLALASAGAAGGLALAAWITGWLRAVIVTGGGPSFLLPIDWRVAAFACGLAALTAALFGLLPVLATRRLDPVAALKAGGRSATADPGQRRARHLLVAGQIALALMLLTTAAVFATGAARALNDDHGWSTDDVVQAELALPEGEEDEAAVAQTFEAIVAQVRQVPGVEAASISYGLPFLGLRGTSRLVGDDRPWPERGAGLAADLNGIYGDYFAVTGTRLISGRSFDARDTPTSPPVRIVSASLGRALFGDGPAIGRRIASAGEDAATWAEVVGVVSDVSPIDMTRERTRFQVYQPATQDLHHQATLALRTSGVSPGPVITAVRQIVSATDPGIVVRNLMPARALADRDVLSQMRLILRLLVAFAGIGVLLSALGTYAVMARMVGQRTAEIGLRMALGAPAAGILRLVLVAALRVVSVGAAAGVVGALLLIRLLGSVFPGIEGGSGLVIVAAVSALAAVALAAAAGPARRASRIDPLVALRAD